MDPGSCSLFRHSKDRPARATSPLRASQPAPAASAYRRLPSPTPSSLPNRSGARSSSELEYLVVLEHARSVLPGAVLNLLHRQLNLPRLQVRDIDLCRALQLGQFLG